MPVRYSDPLGSFPLGTVLSSHGSMSRSKLEARASFIHARSPREGAG